MGSGPSLVKVFDSDVLPVEMKWSCICAGKEMWFTEDECVMRDPGCCFVGQNVLDLVALVLRRFSCRLFERR